MNPILLAVLLLAGLGLGAGLILAIASILMAVPKDEKAEALCELLPGANCGACGYSGCAGYADAMANHGAKVGLCSPGGEAVAKATGEFLGVSGDVERLTALVRCGGCEDFTARKLEYHGLESCRAATQFYGGHWLCNYGCLGYGDCVSACEYGAVSVENGLARVDASLCRGCTKCVAACPRKLIVMTGGATRGFVRCSNHDKGAKTRAACKVGCIGCGKCVKVCEHDAAQVTNCLSSIDPEKCVGCGKCVEACPMNCITLFGSTT